MRVFIVVGFFAMLQTTVFRSPSAFDIRKWRDANLSSLLQSMQGPEFSFHIDRTPEIQNPDRFQAIIRKIPARTVAYIRVSNPYQGDAVAMAYDRLMKWAELHSLADGQWMGYQWDNPEITPLEDCHYQVAVEAEQFIPEGEIGRFQFPPMTVAQVEIRGSLDLELRALQWLYGDWLPSSGYVPDDHPAFEAWIGRPFAHGNSHFELHALLPVKRN